MYGCGVTMLMAIKAQTRTLGCPLLMPVCSGANARRKDQTATVHPFAIRASATTAHNEAPSEQKSQITFATVHGKAANGESNSKAGGR